MKQYSNSVDFRNDMMMKLMKGPCYLIFEKKDGSIRHMMCTLHNQLIPQDTELDPTASKTQRKKSDSSVAVFDITLKQWRSFKLDNVTFFEELNKLDSGMKQSLKENVNA